MKLLQQLLRSRNRLRLSERTMHVLIPWLASIPEDAVVWGTSDAGGGAVLAGEEGVLVATWNADLMDTRVSFARYDEMDIDVIPSHTWNQEYMSWGGVNIDGLDTATIRFRGDLGEGLPRTIEFPLPGRHNKPSDLDFVRNLLAKLIGRHEWPHADDRGNASPTP